MKERWNFLKGKLRPLLAPAVEKSLDPLWKLGFALAVNNNVRMMCLWALTASITIVYVIFFGIIAPMGTDALIDNETQRYENLYRHGEFKTHVERDAYSYLNPLWWIIVGPWRLFVFIVKFILKWVALGLWLWTPLYSVWAIRDEIGQAWEAAVQAVLTTKNIEENLPDVPSTVIQTAGIAGGAPQTMQATPRYLTLRDYLRWEFIVAFLTELLEVIFAKAARGVT